MRHTLVVLLHVCIACFASVALHGAVEPLVIADLAIDPSHWSARQPAGIAISADAQRPGATRFEVSPGTGTTEWVVVDGPVVPLTQRSRFTKDRTLELGVEVRSEGYEGYSLQFRLRQGRTGSGYTRNLSPRRFWESAAEVSQAETTREWTAVTGRSSVGIDCDAVVLEVWILVPAGTKPASFSLSRLSLRESYGTDHLLVPKPWTQGAIFFADQGTMQVDFVDPPTVTTGSITLTDETGKAVGRVEGGPATANLEITLPARGFYQVTAAATYSDRPAISTRTTAAVVGAPLDESVRLASRFGAVRVWGSGDLWRKSGANWDWMIGCVDMGGYVLEADGTIHPPADAKPFVYPTGYQAVGTIGSFPKWLHGRDGDGLYPPKDWSQLERLAEVFARANPGLTRICPYNEPDAHWRGSREDFVRFHLALYAGLKRGNPNLQLVGPGMYSIRMDDIIAYDHLGLLDAQDGMTMHAYVNASAPEGEFMDRILDLTSYLAKRGKAAQPLYLTEFGWCSEVGDWQKPVPELVRASYVARCLALMGTQAIDGIAYFNFMYLSKLEKPEYSLLFKDHSPTPGYVAFVQALRWLSWTQRGDGAWLRLSPDLNLVTYDNGTRASAVVWSGKDPGSIRLPAVPRRCEDTYGRMLPVPADGVIAVSINPVYCDLAIDPAFRALTRLPGVRVPPGARVPLPWAAFFAAPEFTLSTAGAQVSTTALPGDYLIIGRTASGAWQALPIQVVAPISVQSVDYVMSPDGHQLSVVATVTSSLASPAQLTARLVLDEKTVLTASATITPGTAAQPLSVSIPQFVTGRRYRGSFRIELLGQVPWSAERPFDQTVLASAPLALGQAVDWNAIPAVDFSTWGPRPGPIAAADCSATVRTAIAAEGFRLLVEVTDDKHWQGQIPAGMWGEDSVQVAIDVDADRPWQPNNVGNGFNGHRLVEYGFAHPSTGGPAMVWRFRADVPDMKNNVGEPRIQATVVRTGTQTRYEALLPWATLGLERAPAVGSTLGFALVVNDADKGGDRKFLQLFEGIATGRDPERYGRLRILAP